MLGDADTQPYCFPHPAKVFFFLVIVPFPLEYALYQIPVSPARRSRASWNPQLEVTFQYRQDYLEPVIVVVQTGLHMGIGGLEGQFTLAQCQLQAGAQADVVPVFVDHHLGWPVFAGHQHRAELHVVAEVRSLDGVAQPHLDHRSLNVWGIPSGEVDDGGRGMVSEVLANPWQVLDNLNAEASDMLRRADAGQHQKLRRGDGPAADDDLSALNREHFAPAFGFDSDGPVSVKQDAPGGDAAADSQVEAVAGDVQVIDGHAHPHTLDGVAGPG